MEDNTQELEEFSESIDSLREDMESLREDIVSEKEFSDVRSRVRELEGVGSRFTDSEWSALNVLLDSNEFVGTGHLADELDTSQNNARAVVNNLKEKVDLDEKSEGRKKLYDVPDSTREDIFSSNTR